MVRNDNGNGVPDSTGHPRYRRGIISISTLQTDDLFLASDSEPAIYLMSGFAGLIDSWLATARQEKIASLKGAYGYNPTRITRETCNAVHMLFYSQSI